MSKKKETGTIVLVEDEPILYQTLIFELSQQGHTVHHAADGKNGLSLVREHHPDLVILDVMLPELDGLQVLNILSTDNDLEIAKIPVIILTAIKLEGNEMMALDQGAVDYITKPFSLGTFLARVRGTIRRKKEGKIIYQDTDEMVFSNLKLDQPGRKVFKAGQELKLSHKEFDLLSYFMRNKGIALSRDTLLEDVWGYDYFIDKRTIDVHVRWLREKIEDNPNEPTRIMTVRGMGYRFEG